VSFAVTSRVETAPTRSRIRNDTQDCQFIDYSIYRVVALRSPIHRMSNSELLRTGNRALRETMMCRGKNPHVMPEPDCFNEHYPEFDTVRCVLVPCPSVSMFLIQIRNVRAYAESTVRARASIPRSRYTDKEQAHLDWASQRFTRPTRGV
jgi:hypothetical protein